MRGRDMAEDMARQGEYARCDVCGMRLQLITPRERRLREDAIPCRQDQCPRRERDKELENST